MNRSEELITVALKSLPPKPADAAPQGEKKRYSELMSQVLAAALAEELRQRGLKEARPVGDGEIGISGAERRMSGGIGAKKVDVTWATEESGLILAISVKCITSKDTKTGNYQKNLVNRRGDMLGEAVTLHRRFPYAVLGGFIFFDKGAAEDSSDHRSSTFLNAHRALRLFTGRTDPAGRDEQYERLYIALVDATPFSANVKYFLAGSPKQEISLDQALDELLRLASERNADFYAAVGPNDMLDPPPDASPLELVRVRSSGTIIKPAKPKVAAKKVILPSAADISKALADNSTEED